MDLTVEVWRQRNATAPGEFVAYQATNISPHMSFLEMLDVLNQQLIDSGQEPIAFDHDCREGICGSCGLMINGEPHGPRHPGTATCQLHMRNYKDGDVIRIEPWRAAAFPVIRDLVVNRGAFDRIIAAGGYVTARTGSAPEADTLLIPKDTTDNALDAAACIGCGACVAACPNASAMLFTAAKVTHLNILPQGQPERYSRVGRMVAMMDEQGFGNCTNHGSCQSACPANITVDVIASLNRDLLRASLTPPPEVKEEEPSAA